MLALVKAKLQEEALRTYLFAYAGQYVSLSQGQLAAMFDLPEARVYSLVSKMMIAEELQGEFECLGLNIELEYCFSFFQCDDGGEAAGCSGGCEMFFGTGVAAAVPAKP